MPLYQMPDGNDYEFTNDSEATVAMEQWNKQFGQQQPQTNLWDKIKGATEPVVNEAKDIVGRTFEALPSPMRGGPALAEALYDMTVGLIPQTVGAGMEAKQFSRNLESGADPDTARELARNYREANKLPWEVPKPILPESKQIEDIAGQAFSGMMKGAGAISEVSEAAKNTLLGRFGYNVDPKLAKNVSEMGAEVGMILGPALHTPKPRGIGFKNLKPVEIEALRKLVPEEVATTPVEPSPAPKTFYVDKQGNVIDHPLTDVEMQARAEGVKRTDIAQFEELSRRETQQTAKQAGAETRLGFEQEVPKQPGLDFPINTDAGLVPELAGRMKEVREAQRRVAEAEARVQAYETRAAEATKANADQLPFRNKEELFNFDSQMLKEEATRALDELNQAKEALRESQAVAEQLVRDMNTNKYSIEKVFDPRKNDLPPELQGIQDLYTFDPIKAGKDTVKLLRDNLNKLGTAQLQALARGLHDKLAENIGKISPEEQKIIYETTDRISDILAAREGFSDVPPPPSTPKPTGFKPRVIPGGKQSGMWKPFETSAKEPKASDILKKFKDVEDLRKSLPPNMQAQAEAIWNAGKQGQQITNQAIAAKKTQKLLGRKDHIPVVDWNDHQRALDIINHSEDINYPNAFEDWFMSRGGMIAESHKNPAITAGIDIIKGTVDYFQERGQQWLNKPGGIIHQLNRIENLYKPGLARDVLLQRITAKGDPNYKFQWENAAQEALHTKIEEIFNTMASEVNERRALQGKEPIKGLPNYFGSLFKGNHYFTIRDAKGRLLEIFTSRNRYRAQLYNKILKARGLNVGKVEQRRMGRDPRGDPANAIAEYELMQDLWTDTDPRTVEAKNMIDRMVRAEATTNMGYHNRMKEWHGIKGFEGGRSLDQRLLKWAEANKNANYYDAKAALMDLVDAHNSWVAAHKLADFLEKLNEGRPMAAKEFLSYEIQRQISGNPEHGIVKAMQDVIQTITGFDAPKQRSLINGYSAITTAQLTGWGSARALAQNFLQPMMASIPKMLQLMTKEGHSFDMVTPLVFGLKDFAEVLARHQSNESLQLITDMTKHDTPLSNKVFGVDSNHMYQWSTKMGFTDPTMIEPRPLFKRKGNQAPYRYASGFVVRSSEQAARFAFFTTMVRYMRKADAAKGISLEQTYAKAANLTETYMTDYSQNSRARIFSETGLLGTMAGRLSTFQFNNYSQLYVYLKEAVKTGNPIPAMAMMSLIGAMAGIIGMPGFHLADAIYNNIIPDNWKSDPRETLKGIVLKKTPEAFSTGLLSQVTNQGLFGAFGISTPFQDNPLLSGFPVMGMAGEHFNSLSTLGSAGINSLIGNEAESFSSLTDPELGRAFKGITPSSSASIIEDLFLKTPEGVIRSPMTGDPIYKEKPGEETKGNITSFGRARSGVMRREFKKEEKAVNEKKKENLSELYRVLVEVGTFGKITPAKKMRLTKLVNDHYGKFGGTELEVEKVLVDAEIPDELQRTLKETWTSSNFRSKSNALKYQQKLKEE